MATADVLKEFLVKLAYQVDANSQKKFETGLKGATTAAVEMGKAIAVLSAAVGVATAKISSDLDQLYFQSQRSNAAASSIRGMAYAVSQLGGSYQAASQSIDTFSAKLRQNPGYESMVRQLGVATRVNGQLRDTPKIMADLAQKLRGKQYHVAFQYAQDLGFDEATFRSMMSGEYQKRLDEFAAKAQRMGVDLGRSAETGNRFSDAMRSLGATLGLLGDKINDSTAPGLTALIKQFDDFLQKNAKDIVRVVEDVVRVFKDLGDGLAWVGEKLRPVWEGFDSLSKSIGGRSGVTVAIEALIALKLAKWLFGISRAILAVGASAGTVMGGGALARLFMLLRIGGTAALAAPLLGGADTPESYEQRRQNDPEFRRKTDEANAGNGGLIGKIKKWWNGGSSPTDFGGGTFRDKAPKIMEQLQKDFGLSKEQAAGVMGNLGHESAGLTQLQEKNPMIPGSRGGWGWAQWTGPRRRAFEAWAAENGLDPSSDAANYGFLKHELQTSHKGAIAAVKGTQTVNDAMVAFEGRYEQAGIKSYGSRQKWAERAMRAAEDAERSKSTASSSPLTRNGYAIPNFGVGQASRNFIPSGANGVAPWAQFNVPLAPSPDGGVSLNQNTTINVTGATDPSGTASAVQGAQKSVNQGLMRNIQGATR